MHAVDSGVLIYQRAETWWSILPHLAAESDLDQGSDRLKGLKALKSRFNAYYQTHRVQSKLNLKKFSLKWIKGKGPPKLRAKAGQASALVTFTANLAKEFDWADGSMGSHRCLSMEKMAGICSLAKKELLTHDELSTWRCLAAYVPLCLCRLPS